jgi:hypothetical protein
VVIARLLGWVGFGTAVCLVLFFIVEGPFGAINDVGNALLGVLSAVLAWTYRQPAPFAVAVLGAAITVVGTALVMSEATGYYLAGLVSSAGFALIGGWLIAVNRRTDRVRVLGIVAGAVMLLGLIGVPGIVTGVDYVDIAPAYTFVAGVSWLGTYLLFPAWALTTTGEAASRRVGPQRQSGAV